MSRRLNIERRRKRIRHYTARRRRRSPVHRAVLFWWGTVLLLGLTGCLIGLLLLLRSVWRPGWGGESRWELPRASLCLIYASESDVSEALRMGNARRSACAMSDADIGISFEMPLPEPEEIAFDALPPLPASFAARDRDACSLASLPPMYQGPIEVSTAPASVYTVATLTKVGYLPTLRANPEPNTRGTATFFVRLDESGRAQHVLRLSPVGEETPWLKLLRKHLLRTRGTAAATGRVTFTWNTKDLP